MTWSTVCPCAVEHKGAKSNVLDFGSFYFSTLQARRCNNCLINRWMFGRGINAFLPPKRELINILDSGPSCRGVFDYLTRVCFSRQFRFVSKFLWCMPDYDTVEASHDCW